MKVVALISGGKDSCYNMMQCVAEGHDIVALANLKPAVKDELDSYMYQTVGHQGIEMFSEAMGLPLYRRVIRGGSVEIGSDYVTNSKDEVEDLYELLKQVKEKENIKGVSVGAILSNYQRVRVENVCGRLGLTSLAYLWRRDQSELLKEMVDCGVNAVLIKVAAMGLDPGKHLCKSLAEMQPYLESMSKKIGLNVCGEGGEYETFTLDCPLFHKRIVVEEKETVSESDSPYDQVGYVNFTKLRLENKNIAPSTSFLERLKGFPMKRSLDLKEELGIHETVTSTEKTVTKRGNSEEKIETLGNTTELSICKLSNNVIGVSQVLARNDLKDIEGSVQEAMKALEEVIEQEGFQMSDIMINHLYVQNMDDFGRINSVYKSFFGINPPSRICVGAGLPPDVSMQLDCLVSKSMEGGNQFSRNTMHVQGLSHWAPANIGPYSQVVQVGSTMFVAGQIAMCPSDLSIISGGIKAEARLSLRHVSRILSAMKVNCKLSNVQLCICYLTAISYVSIAALEWQEALEEEDMGMPLELENIGCLVQYVVIPTLPKYCSIEWQVVAEKGEGQWINQHVARNESKFTLHCEYKYCDEEESETSFSGFHCKATVSMTTGAQVNCSTYLETFLNLFEDIRAKMTVKARVSVFRIFYIQGRFSHEELCTEYSRLSNKIVSEPKPVATFVPVLDLEPSSALLSICC